MHLQAVDEFELAIRNETTWIQGMPGEDRVCGGCHEDRTQPSLPGGQQITNARGRGPEDFMVPVLQRTEYPWSAANDPANPNQIQTLLNAKCVSCHNETKNGKRRAGVLHRGRHESGDRRLVQLHDPAPRLVGFARSR